MTLCMLNLIGNEYAIPRLLLHSCDRESVNNIFQVSNVRSCNDWLCRRVHGWGFRALWVGPIRTHFGLRRSSSDPHGNYWPGTEAWCFFWSALKESRQGIIHMSRSTCWSLFRQGNRKSGIEQNGKWGYSGWLQKMAYPCRACFAIVGVGGIFLLCDGCFPRNALLFRGH